MSWFEEVEESEADATEPTVFETRLKACVDGNTVEDITLPVLSQNIGDVEDGDLLARAYTSDERDNAKNLYATRMEELGVAVPSGEDVEDEAEPEAPEPNVVEVEASTDGGDATDEVVAEAYADAAETEDEPVPETAPAPVEEATPRVDVTSIAPDVLTVQEAAKRPYRWMTMVWADPGEGKSYYSHTAPGPIAYIDTEGKAHDLADKFVDKEIYYLQPTDYDEAVDALDKALAILDEYRREHGVIGTIVVDSMSIMWEWAQSAYVHRYYPGRDPSDVRLKGGPGESDWKVIKEMHNDAFRARMVESPYHLVWTAMRQDDYTEVFGGQAEEPADKPGGEKNNIYKVNHILRIERDEFGVPVARLQKCGRSKYNFRGMPFPTHDMVAEAVEHLATNEADLTHGDTFTVSGVEVEAVIGREDSDHL